MAAHGAWSHTKLALHYLLRSLGIQFEGPGAKLEERRRLHRGVSLWSGEMQGSLRNQAKGVLGSAGAYHDGRAEKNQKGG